MNNKFNDKDVSNVSRIQGTNDNSILSKCSMIKYGYFSDEFLPHMIGKFSRRAPLINRGYYIRAKAIEYVLLNFIDKYQSKKFQIISLGAGFDTSFFRLSKQGKLTNCTFIEMDYFDVAQRKANLMQQEPNLWNCLENPENVPLQKDSYIIINASNYKLLGIDLTKLDILDACIRASGVSYELPTLFLSECVITYISTKKSSNLLKFIAKSFSENCFVLYEQIHPDDSFGKFMCQHFKQLGSSLRGISTYKTKVDQIKRFINAGWERATGCDMSDFYYNIIDSTEKARIENLEVFDEYEEWMLKCNHYLVLVACKGMDWDLRISVGDSAYYCKNYSSPLPLRLLQQPYQSDQTELYKNGGIKTHYVHGELIYSTGNNNREFLLRASGYGQNPFSSGHCRLSCLSILDLASNLMSHIVPDRSELLLNSLCGSMTRISTNQFLMFGGRSSPLKPNNLLTSLQLTFDEVSSGWRAQCDEVVNTSSGDCTDKPCARWRHAAGVYWIRNEAHLLVYGGRTSNPMPLSDTCVMNVARGQWSHLQCNNGPGPLCSASIVSVGTGPHSATIDDVKNQCCGCCCLIVFGGLSGRELRPSSDLWRWCGRSRTWTKIKWDGDSALVLPRFSHTAHIINRSTQSSSTCGAVVVKMIILGGVSHQSPFCGSSLISIDLIYNRAHCVDVGLETSNIDSECVMVHNHGSVFSQSTKKIWIIGGGGNCFSFGTQLNENIYSIDIDRDEFYQ